MPAVPDILYGNCAAEAGKQLIHLIYKDLFSYYVPVGFADTYELICDMVMHLLLPFFSGYSFQISISFVYLLISVQIKDNR